MAVYPSLATDIGSAVLRHTMTAVVMAETQLERRLFVDMLKYRAWIIPLTKWLVAYSTYKVVPHS